MKKQLEKLFFIFVFMFLIIFAFSVKVHAEGTKDMYDWTSYSTTSGENDRWFFYYNEDNSVTNGVKNDSVIKVYAKEGETIKFATSGTGFKVTKPGETTPSTVSISQTNGAVGFICNANQERDKTYTYVRMVADKTGIYTFKLLQQREVRSANVNGKLGIRNINSGDAAFTGFQTVAYVAAWDVQVENAEGEDLTGRIWMDYVSVYRGYQSYNNNSKGNVDFYILTDDGYVYDMKCRGMDPGGMNFFIGTRGLVDKNTNQILYQSVNESVVGSSVLMPVPSNGNTEFDSFGKIFFNKPAEDLPLSIKKEPTPTRILENLTFNEEENRGEAKLAGTFSFSISDPCMYTIKICDKNTGTLVRTLNSSGVSGKNTIIWDGKNNSGSYVDAGEYSATLELRNGEYHFILIDVETIYGGITIKSEENGNSTLYYNNAPLSGVNASESGINSETTPFNYGFEFGDRKMINLWTYNSTQSTTDFFVMDAYQGTKSVLKGRVFFDENNSKSYDTIDKPISGVKMKITNTTTGEVYTAETTTNGEFFANVLKNATYRIEVSEEFKNGKLAYYSNTTNNEIQTKSVTGDINVGDIGYYSQTKELTINKVWDDFDNVNGFRPDSITVKILDGEKEIGRCLVKANLGWTTKISLPKYNNSNQEVIYTLEELEVNDFYKLENATITQSGNVYTITNQLEVPDDKVLVEIRKQWNDNDNEFGLRPDKITGTVTSSLNTTIPYTVSKTNGWVTKFMLDKYDSNGRIITYTVDEDAIDQYTSNIAEEDNVFTITNNLVERINLTVTKKWIDESTTSRPEYVVIHLFEGDTEVDSASMSADGNWSYVFRRSPKYRDDGSLIEYSVTEDEVFGYSLEGIEFVSNNSVEITNKWFDNISITVRKSWNDSDDKIGVRPDNILVDIVNKNTNEVIKSNIEIEASENWSKMIRGLRKFDEDNNEIEYKVVEKTIDNYVLTEGYGDNVQDTETENQKICNLTNSLDSIKIQLQKVWNDDSNQKGQRPDEVEVSVYANGRFLEKVYIKKSENWQKIIGPYSKYDGNRREISYTVEESDVSLYELESITEEEASGEGTVVFSRKDKWQVREDGTYETTSQNQHSSTATLTSDYFTLNNPGTISFDWSVSSESISYDYVYYVLKDSNNTVVKGGTGTKIGGTGYGSVYSSLTFIHNSFEVDAGTYKFEFYYVKDSSSNSGLDQAFVKNVKYTKEANVDSVYVIKNKINIPDEKMNLTIEKNWDDNNNLEGKRPEEIKVNLYADETLNQAIILNPEGNWQTVINDLPIYDTNGNKIKYTVKELDTNSLFYNVENSVITSAENKITITNKYDRPQEKIDIEIKKTWNDNNNQAGKRPDSITCNLYGNETLVKTIELNANDNWSEEITGLYKYDEEGNVINYTVSENNVSMYTLTSNEKAKKLEQTALEINTSESTSWSRNTDGTWQSNINGQSGQTATLKSKPFTLLEKSNLEFDWSVSSESVSYDYLNYTIKNANGVSISTGTAIGGEGYGSSYESLSFMHKSIELEAGTYTIEFYYRKDGSVDKGLDKGFVKNLQFLGESESGFVYKLTNKYEAPDETFSLKINKVWDDNDNENGRRPSSIEVGLYENGTKRNIITLNESEGWTKTISNLARKYPSGEDIEYSVVEENTNSNFYKKENAEISEIENNEVTITNKFELPLETMNLVVKKAWDDNNNQAGKRPEEVTFAISANTEIIGQYTLKAEENWEKTIENLRVYSDDGEKIVYRTEEVDINSIFYRLVSYEENGNTIILTNTFEIPDTQTFLIVKNKWDDLDNKAKKRPETHRVELFANDLPTGEKYDLNANESWVYTFNNLDKYDENGDEIEYSVRENTPANYKLVSNVRTGDTVTITNRYRANNETISIAVKKLWDDNDDEAEKRPESINIQLLANGEVEQEHTLTATENWQYTFADLYKYDYDNNEIVYTVIENPIDENYVVSNLNSSVDENVSDLIRVDLTNTFSPNEEKKTITVNKVWDDNDNQAEKRPESIVVNLKLNDEILNTKQLNESNNWSAVFEDISKYDSYNNELTYVVEEVCDSIFYSKTNYQNENDVISITNTFSVPDEKININAVKMWTDKNNIKNDRPSSITFILRANDVEIDRKEVSGNSTTNEDWEYTFTDLAKYDSNGDIIVYTIDEEADTDLYVKEVNGLTVVNTYKLNNSIIKNDTIKKTGSKFIENRDEKVDYKLEYSATIEEFYGNAKIAIIDTLPYSIDENESELAGGIYNSESKTITWVENIDNIDTYTNGVKTVEIEKELSLKYVGIKEGDTRIKNYVEANTKLEKANVESTVDDEWDTDIKLPVQEEVKVKEEPEIKIEEKGGEVEEQTTEPVEKEVKFEVQYEAKAEVETKTQTKKIMNPPTGDNIKTYLIMFEIALIVFNSIAFIKKKDK